MVAGTVGRVPGSDSARRDGELTIERPLQTLRDGDRVEIPVRLRRGDDVNFIQFSIEYDDTWLEYVNTELPSPRWRVSPFGPWTVDPEAARVQAVLAADPRPEGDGAPAGLGEGAEGDAGEVLVLLTFRVDLSGVNADTHRLGASVAFTRYRVGSLTQDPREETFLGWFQGDTQGGTLNRVAALLGDGGVDITFGESLELGSGSITQRQQEFVLPLYMTRLESLHFLEIGVDYDELIMRLSAVRTRVSSDSSAAGDELPFVLQADGRGAHFTLDLEEDGAATGPWISAHVADLVFELIDPDALGAQPAPAAGAGPAGPAEDGVPAEVEDDAVRILPFERNDDAQAVGELRGDGKVARSADSVPGVLRPLMPHFIRGNVDSSVSSLQPLLEAQLNGEDSAEALARVARPELDDALQILEFLFLPNDGHPICREAADVNNDGRLLIDDPVHLLAYLFSAGAQPAAPFPQAAARDTVRDPHDLGCESSLPWFQLD